MKRNEQETQVSQSQQPNTYQTGFTAPPKKYSILVATLLVLIVFLLGLVSLMGLVNFKLFSTLYGAEEQQEEIPVSLENQQLTEAALPETTIPPETKIIGITGEPVTAVYQQHFHLPEGLFITFVAEGTSAHRQGIQEGDVLLSLADIKITAPEQLRSFLENRTIGDVFEALLYRRDTDSHFTVQLTIEKATS